MNAQSMMMGNFVEIQNHGSRPSSDCALTRRALNRRVDLTSNGPDAFPGIPNELEVGLY